MKKITRLLAGFLAAAVSLVSVHVTAFADETVGEIDSEVIEKANEENVPDAYSLTIEECIEYVNDLPEPENNSDVGITAIPISDEEAKIIGRVLENDYSQVNEQTIYKESKYTFSSRYYYNQLSPKMKSAYDDMEEACEEFLNSSVTLSSDAFAEIRFDDYLSSLDELSQLYWIFYYSNPQYFFLKNTYGYYLDFGGIILKTYDNCKSSSTKTQIRSGIDSLTDNFMGKLSAVGGNVNKEITVAQLISDYVTYQSGADYNQSLMSALYFKETVCNGYAMSMNYFCNALGIDCITVTSSNHAWNRVLLNGKWFEADVTWYDVDVVGDYWDTWLNKSTATFLKNDQQGSHVVETSTVMYNNITLPSCVSDDPFATLSAPTNVKATAGDKQVKLTWTAVSGATKYRIQRLNDSKWGTIATVTTNSYTNTGLTNGTKYSYRVLASADGSTWSSASAVVSATPAAAVKVSTPTNVKATAGDKQIKLTWTAVSGATKYRIQRLNNSTWGTIATVSTNGYTNTGLTNGTKYSYRVLASADGSTWSSASTVVSATPAAAENDKYEYEYNSNLNGIMIAKYNGSDKIITIPSKIDGYTVVAISDGAFLNCTSLTSITVPNSVRTMGSYAFSGCSSLKNITLSNNIPFFIEGTFSGCSSLSNIILPDSITDLGSRDFWGCKSLISMSMPKNTTYIGEFEFYGCEKLKSITIPASVTTISTQAFYGCNSLTDVYYSGSESQWNEITIYDGSDCLLNATIHYNS